MEGGQGGAAYERVKRGQRGGGGGVLSYLLLAVQRCYSHFVVVHRDSPWKPHPDTFRGASRTKDPGFGSSGVMLFL